jgi:hypothetical protein
MTLLEQLGIQQAMIDSVKKTTETSTRTLVSSALKDRVSELLQDVASGIAGVFLASVTSSVLKSLVRSRDQILSKLDELRSEPLATGVRVAEETYSFTGRGCQVVA